MSGRIKWEWVSPVDSSVLVLSEFSDSMEVVKGITGFGAPALRIDREPVPGMPGARTRSRNHDIGEIQVPIWIEGSDVDDLENKVINLVRKMNGLYGDGILRRTSLGGRVSELSCTCTDGLRFDQANLVGPNILKTTLTFQADDPYWRGEERKGSFVGSAGSSMFPMLPLTLAPSSILGNQTITTDSDVTTFPLWKIVGPGTNPSFYNFTTNEVWSLTGTLAAGETLTVDTEDFIKTVTGPDGIENSWFPKLTQYQLWGLRPGPNRVALLVGNTSSQSYVAYSYRDRRLMP